MCRSLRDDLCSDFFVLKDPNIAELPPLLFSFLDWTSMKDQISTNTSGIVSLIHMLIHIIYTWKITQSKHMH